MIISTGSNNTCIGTSNYPTSSSAITNYTGIGYNVGYASSGSNYVELGNTSVTTIRAAVTGITAYSDERIKQNIQDDVPGLSFITKLRPVTYNINLQKQNEILYGDSKKDVANWDGKYDIEQKKQTGFLAQQVEQAALQINDDYNGMRKPKNTHSELDGRN